MPNTKKLLSITNLKKYFPVARTSIFQRGRLYVRANEEITLDIHDGETIGVVGESGCGKSTFGRVLLQLYEQTSGHTMYYGRSVYELAPRYIKDTLKHATRYVHKYKEAQKKADRLEKECEMLGERASFFQLQSKNLAVANARSAFMDVAKILGGFMVLDTDKGAAVLLKRYEIDVKIVKNRAKHATYQATLEFLTQKGTGTIYKQKAKKLERIRKKLQELDLQWKRLQENRTRIEEVLERLRATHVCDEEFQRHEEFLDDGIDLSRLRYEEMRFLRKDLQIIFQDPYSSLDPRMTIGQNIEEGLITHHFFKRGSAAMQAHILQTMRACGLQDYMLHRYPHQFSGGQRQRICIARALALKPKFIVCDECVSALDVSIQSQIINLLQELQEKEKFTYLFISHDLSVVRYISNRIAVMYLGNVVELAESESIFQDPRHPYTVALLSAIPTTNPEELGKERIILEGNIPSPIRPPSGCKFHTRCFMACEKCKRVPPRLEEVEPNHFVACHFPQKKLDEGGRYLFSLKRTEKSRTMEKPSEGT